MAVRPYKPIKRRDARSPKGVVAQALVEAGGPRKLAGTLQRGRSTLHAYGDPDHPTHAPFDAVCDLVASGATAPVQHLCAVAGGTFTPGRPLPDPFPVLAARASKAHGDLTARIVDALADSTISASERAAILVDLDTEIELLVAARTRLAKDGEPS